MIYKLGDYETMNKFYSELQTVAVSSIARGGYLDSVELRVDD